MEDPAGSLSGTGLEVSCNTSTTFIDQDSVVAQLIAKDAGKCSCWSRRKRDPVW